MDTATPGLLVLKNLAGNLPPHLNTLQLWLLPHAGTITAFWWGLWCVTALYLLERLIREYLASRA